MEEVQNNQVDTVTQSAEVSQTLSSADIMNSSTDTVDSDGTAMVVEIDPIHGCISISMGSTLKA